MMPSDAEESKSGSGVTSSFHLSLSSSNISSNIGSRTAAREREREREKGTQGQRGDLACSALLFFHFSPTVDARQLTTLTLLTFLIMKAKGTSSLWSRLLFTRPTHESWIPLTSLISLRALPITPAHTALDYQFVLALPSLLLVFVHSSVPCPHVSFIRALILLIPYFWSLSRPCWSLPSVVTHYAISSWAASSSPSLAHSFIPPSARTKLQLKTTGHSANQWTLSTADLPHFHPPRLPCSPHDCNFSVLDTLYWILGTQCHWV